MSRPRAALAALVTVAGTLAAAPAALAVTEKELREGLPKDSGSAVPQFGMDTGGGLLRGVLGLAAVIAVILIVAKVLRANQARALGGGSSTDALEVLSTTPLGPSQRLHMVRVGSEVLLVGAGEGGVAKLRSFSTEEAVKLGVLAPDYAPGSEASFAAAMTRAGAPADPVRAGLAGLPAPRPAKRRTLADRLRQISAR